MIPSFCYVVVCLSRTVHCLQVRYDSSSICKHFLQTYATKTSCPKYPCFHPFLYTRELTYFWWHLFVYQYYLCCGYREFANSTLSIYVCSSKHIWENYCLTHQSEKLIDGNSAISSHGIRSFNLRISEFLEFSVSWYFCINLFGGTRRLL